MLHYWRIPFSLSFVALFAATLVMWWRSYRWTDSAYCFSGNSKFSCIYSMFGEIGFVRDKVAGANQKLGWTRACSEITEQVKQHCSSLPKSNELRCLGFRGGITRGGWAFHLPYWFPVAAFAALAGLPWYW